MPNHRKCNIQKQSFMLFFVLFLTAGSGSYGSEEEEASGDDTTALVVIVTPSPKIAAEFFTTASDHDLKPAITPAETEINFKTGNDASPSLNDGNIPEIGNNSNPELNDLNNDNTPEAAGVQLALIFGILVLILVLLILPIIFFVIRHKRKKSKEDELGSENVKSPIFEEDTPSVMEIEMEDLDKWMNNMNKNAECECLPTVNEEEKESNVFTSDCES